MVELQVLGVGVALLEGVNVGILEGVAVAVPEGVGFRVLDGVGIGVGVGVFGSVVGLTTMMSKGWHFSSSFI